MKEIIEKLKEWQENIGCDIRNTDAGWADKLPQNVMQHMTLGQAIGLLENMGNNNNIPK